MNAALEPVQEPSLEPPRKRLLDVTDYHRMREAGIFAPDERVELIEGEIITMPPIGFEHAGLIRQLIDLMRRSIGERALLDVQNPVRLSELSEPQPDVTLLRPRADFYKKGHPTPTDTLLAIEVAKSTLPYDRDVKAPLYARHGIPELWLVDVAGERVVVYSEPDGPRYARMVTHRPPIALEPAMLPGLDIDLSTLFDAG